MVDSSLGNLSLIGIVVATLAGSYVVIGLVIDVVRAVRLRVAAAARAHLATVLFADEDPAAAAAARLGRVSPRVLIPMVQRVAADLDGDADIRLHRLVSSSGMIRAIAGRMRSRSWRRRAQAAALAPLLSEGDPRRLKLLTDRHPTVRARAAAHLEPSDVVDAVEPLLALLSDPNPAARFAAQQALLRGDARIVPHLAAYLDADDGDGIAWALEIAASMPDPRLYPAISRHTRSSDPRRRAVAAGAIAPDAHGVFLLGELIDDLDPDVRSAAVTAAAAFGGEVLATRIGELLSDQSWKVRLAAGQTLAALGPVGALTLRHHLFDVDPYARDMARRALDDIAAREGRPVLPAPVPPGIDPWGDEEQAA